MEYVEYEKMFLLEGSYWWFVGRRDILKGFLEGVGEEGGWQDILEVGCGTGGNFELLDKFGRTIGVDLPEALKWCAKRGFGGLIASRAEALACHSAAFDTVLCLDVMEHLDDDLVAMREMFRVCRPGGHLLLTVPAYNFLWSEHDEALSHRRRYSRKDLEKVVLQAGFRPLRLTHAITFLFFPIVFFRLGQRLMARFRAKVRPAVAYLQMPNFLSSFFVSLLRVESWLLKRFDLPFGVSLICLAQKPKEE
jgi:SAM-dependent methyltransferase